MFEQDRFVVRLQQRVLRDYAIRACFLAGSFGRKTNDPFSDIDIALVYADEAERDRAWAQRADFVQSVLPYVRVKSFDAAHIRPYFHIALYSNGAKADFRFEAQTALAPNYHDRDLLILKDSADWAQQWQARARQTAPLQPQITTDALRALDDRFWIMFWDVFRQVKRGDTVKPFAEFLRALALTLPPLLELLPPEHPAHRQLVQVGYSQAADSTRAQMVSLFDAYVAARDAVVQRYGMAFSADTVFENSLRRLIA